MMYKVIRKFKDKYTKKVYDIGNIIDISESRAAEILGAGRYIEKVEAAPETPPSNKPKGKGVPKTEQKPPTESE